MAGDRTSRHWKRRLSACCSAAVIMLGTCAWASPFSFSNGSINGLIAVGSRPGVGGKTEIEAADDFILTSTTTLTSASFTGLIRSTGAATPTVGEIVIEIYRVFPLDSNNPPSGAVPTRVNSPSDVAIASRDSTVSGDLSFSTSILSVAFTASNSVLNGINSIPNQTTGGEGPVTGQEIEFDVNLTKPFALGPGHYFFVPQVQVSGGEFTWLSSVRPIVPPGTPFAPDLQSWVRNASLDPNWLRVGTDIVGGNPAPTYNLAFALKGTSSEQSIPEPSSMLLFGIAALAATRARRRQH